MCGIVGVVEAPGQLAERNTIAAMNEAILHRGPDEGGIFMDGEVGIGARRLSIIDVRGGHQPIHNEDRTVWTVFNGEIYNYGELRRDLQRRGHHFDTHTDTETIVHLYEEHGIQGIEHLRGMYAFAIWDSNERSLVLVRDRVGIKPLYYACFDGRFIFGSELKSLFRVKGFPFRLNPSAIQEYLSLLYVPGPNTAFEGVHEVPPGHYLVYQKGKISLRRYWEIRYRGEEGLDAKEWEDLFFSQFRDSVKSHLVSDVPLGAFLSGGIDSSAIVGVMAQESGRPVETFSVGHEGAGSFQDERRYARIVAKRFGTNHHELVVTTDVKDLLPKLARCFDQPFADSSAIPNYYISEVTKRHVTVVLSGLGGDEIGAGYERYIGMMFAETYRKLPKVLRHHLWEKWVMRSKDDWTGRPWLNRIKRFIMAADLAPPASYASMQTTFSSVEQQRLLTNAFRARSAAATPESLMAQAMGPDLADTILNGALLADMYYYLPGDLLTLTDRVSMQHSLEVRVPFLDHPLVELMARVPARYKASGWTKKRLLKRAFHSLLPGEILHRTKMGFSVPLALWLRTDLCSTMKDILAPSELKNISYLNVSEVESIMTAHLAGEANHETKLWALINLVCWHREFPQVTLQ